MGVWNFIGAGVFGFLINTPIVSYFEMGTTLTTNHGHAAIANGYWHARRLDFTMGGLFHVLEWVRIGGDTVFLVLGALPMAVAALRSWLRRDAPVSPAPSR